MSTVSHHFRRRLEEFPGIIGEIFRAVPQLSNYYRHYENTLEDYFVIVWHIMPSCDRCDRPCRYLPAEMLASRWRYRVPQFREGLCNLFWEFHHKYHRMPFIVFHEHCTRMLQRFHEERFACRAAFGIALTWYILTTPTTDRMNQTPVFLADHINSVVKSAPKILRRSSRVSVRPAYLSDYV